MPKARTGRISRATLRTQLAAADRFSFIGFGARELSRTVSNDAQIRRASEDRGRATERTLESHRPDFHSWAHRAFDMRLWASNVTSKPEGQ